ncbi:hypothetical protein [Methylobacterium marchantiae]|uniref:Uncharacterized protein n=1 Tax=Methylobacterium marchantiae TaxID=600331 RepID=A0ABW3X5M4_9HYPH|nr:hypothetical protein AIGOOFII_3912 [Methylobacterium marchantiae]
MPDFVAALITAAAFCAAVIVTNALTRWALQLHIAPADLAENGLLQYGVALAFASSAWKRALGRRSL